MLVGADVRSKFTYLDEETMNFTKLRNLMDSFVEWRIPGCGCVVYKDHNPIFKYSSGYADVTRKLPFDAEKNLLFMYSCSKPVTVVCAMTLYEEGRFDLNEPVSKYIPEFADVTVEYPDHTVRKAKNEITIGNLFEMTSGLDYNLNRPHFSAAKENLKPHCNTVDMMRELIKDPLIFEPGEKWCYGMSLDVIGALIEVISGKNLRDFADERIFKPLGMTDSSYGMKPNTKHRFAKQYHFYDERDSYDEIELTNGFEFGDDFFSGGASLVSTIPDMAIFADTLACGGISKDGVRILSSHTIDLIKSNRLNKKQRESVDWGTLKGYGYGLGVRTLMSPALAGASSPVGEFGWTGAAGAYLMCDTENKLSIYYAHHMTNNQEYFTVPRLRNVLYSCIE